VSFPSVALFAAARAVRHVAASLKRDNSLAEVGDALMSLPDYYALVGLHADDGARGKLRPRCRRSCHADRCGVMPQSVAETPRRPKIGVAHHHWLPLSLTLP
jgi:hypothetical protein